MSTDLRICAACLKPIDSSDHAYRLQVDHTTTRGIPKTTTFYYHTLPRCTRLAHSRHEAWDGSVLGAVHAREGIT